MDKNLRLDYFVAISQLKSQLAYPLVATDLLGKKLSVWLRDYLDSLGVKERPIIADSAIVAPTAHIEGPVFIGAEAVVEPFAYIKGPAYIGPKTEVRHTAYIRGDVYAGSHCVIGHATEVKASVFFDGAKAGHFAYVGDSILGREVNLGAGTKLANLKFRGDEVKVKHPETGEIISTGLRKLGAICGDSVQIGCNAVLGPGALLAPETAVLPCNYFKGTLTKGLFGSASQRT